MAGLLVLLLTSIPPALAAGAGLPGLIIAYILIGMGVGGIKSSVAPFTADQLKNEGQQIEISPDGKRVIIDHEVTVRRIYSIFYWCTNVGALSGPATTSMEKHIGFWSAFLLALGSLVLGTLILVSGRKQYCRSLI